MRFQREAEALATLNHPNTLEDFIARGRVPLEEALTVALPIAQALANIKRTTDGQVKVLDFGLAKVSAGSATFMPSDRATTPGDDISSNGANPGTVA